MHTNLLPAVVAVFLGVMPVAFGQPESVLQLEAKHGKSPFQDGEQLDIQSDSTVIASATRITVLDIAHWPWVRVKSEREETWLNFDHVVIAKKVVAAK